MLKIEVRSGVQEKQVESKRNGQHYTFFEQECLLALNGETRRVRLSHRRAEQGLKPGVYTFDVEKSLRVDGFGNLRLGRLELQPVVAAARA